MTKTDQNLLPQIATITISPPARETRAALSWSTSVWTCCCCSLAATQCHTPGSLPPPRRRQPRQRSTRGRRGTSSSGPWASPWTASPSAARTWWWSRWPRRPARPGMTQPGRRPPATEKKDQLTQPSVLTRFKIRILVGKAFFPPSETLFRFSKGKDEHSDFTFG